MIRTRFAAAFLLLPACCALATQTVASAAEGLRGVPAFTIRVEGLDEHAMKCAISTQGIETSARSILQQSKVPHRRSESPGRDAFLYYNVNVISLPSGQCFFSFSLDAQLIGELKVGTRTNPGAYTAWRRGGIRSTFKGNAASTLAYDIEALTKSFVAAWSEANPQAAHQRKSPR